METIKRSPRTRVTELRCSHSYTGENLYSIRAYGFDLFMCDKCFNNLITLINHILLTIGKGEGFNFRRLGIHCDRCDQWRVGGFYMVNYTKLREEKHIDGKGNEISSLILESGRATTKCYCEECFKTMERHKVIVETRRDIYIPAEIEDKVVTSLFEDRLEKTEKILTLVPTVALEKVFEVLSPEQREEVMQLMSKEFTRIEDRSKP